MNRIIPLTLALALAAGGCSLFHRDEPATPPDPPDQSPYLKETAVEPDPEAEAAGPTAVESALAWSEKYARAVEQLASQQEENRTLADQKRELQQKITALEAELAQTRRELKDANDLLIDVRRANEKWKGDVLGYRDEMRQAHQAELEALRKVLRLLGGEVPESTTTAKAETAPETGTAAEADTAPETGTAAEADSPKPARQTPTPETTEPPAPVAQGESRASAD